MRKFLGGVWLLLTFLLFAIGFAGIPEDLKTWNTWIANYEGVFRFLSVAIALSMLYMAFSRKINAFWLPSGAEIRSITPEKADSQERAVTSKKSKDLITERDGKLLRHRGFTSTITSSHRMESGEKFRGTIDSEWEEPEEEK